MKQFNINIAICFFAALFGFNSWCATYYVSPTGNDSSSGSSTAPWKTPYKAFRATLKPGDIVYFRSGNYTMTGDGISVRSSGTSSAPITFASQPGHTAVIVYDRRKKLVEPTLEPIIYIGSSNIIMDRLSIRQVETSRAYAISVGETSDGFSVFGTNVKIKNCSIDNVAGLGVYVKGSNVLVENCRISNHGSHSFYIAGANGIYRNNTLNCSRGGWNSRCIQIQYVSSTGNKIYGNLVMNGQSGGVVFSGPVTNNLVYNNIFISNGTKLDTGHGLYGVVLDFWHETGKIPGLGNKFYNNTIMGKKPNTSLINRSSDGANVVVTNNIFRTTMPAPIGGIASKIKNNVFFNTVGSVPSGNITKDPKLVNPAGTTAASAKFLSGSSAYNTGIDTGLRVDYFNTARPRGGRLDIGAYEY